MLENLVLNFDFQTFTQDIIFWSTKITYVEIDKNIQYDNLDLQNRLILLF